MRRIAPLFLGLMAMPATALAQEDEPEPTVQYADETVLTEDAFHDLKIDSMVARPGQKLVQPRSEAARFTVLFHLRLNFDNEMSESVDLIR
jgi:hypothetical protein